MGKLDSLFSLSRARLFKQRKIFRKVEIFLLQPRTEKENFPFALTSKGRARDGEMCDNPTPIT
jgi:hypothetical protein